MNLPKKYAWLSQEDGPRHLLKALELYGVAETVGPKHNPVIMGWAKECGFTWYTNDETPWCGLFVATVMKRAERPFTMEALRALSWETWGVGVKEPMLGDVLTFKRDGGGHVGIYVGETKNNYLVLGGNQGNQVQIVPILKSRLHAARRPAYNNQPANIRKIVIAEDGTPVSTNEA